MTGALREAEMGFLSEVINAFGRESADGRRQKAAKVGYFYFLWNFRLRQFGSMQDMRFVLDRWMPKGFPAIDVIYKGRGLEWYPAETPVLFDWMNRKKRVLGTATLALGTNPRFEWQIMRQTDNRFYWLGADRIAPGNLFKENNPGNTGTAYQRATKLVGLHQPASGKSQISPKCRGRPPWPPPNLPFG